MRPGDQRTVYDSKNDRQITINRTSRPYVYDLCDAYNAARSNHSVLWIVKANGELGIVQNGEPIQGRTDWKPTEHELDSIRRAATARFPSQRGD
jgi:hypothetical protein